MAQRPYIIEFDVPIDNSAIIVHLNADVEIDSTSQYIISNFRTGKQNKESVLPALTLKQKNGEWVHIDTEQQTFLSKLIGKSIEALDIQIREVVD